MLGPQKLSAAFIVTRIAAIFRCIFYMRCRWARVSRLARPPTLMEVLFFQFYRVHIFVTRNMHNNGNEKYALRGFGVPFSRPYYNRLHKNNVGSFVSLEHVGTNLVFIDL